MDETEAEVMRSGRNARINIIFMAATGTHRLNNPFRTLIHLVAMKSKLRDASLALSLTPAFRQQAYKQRKSS